MLTVLVLDSLNLAEERDEVTFRLTLRAKTVQPMIPVPTYDYSGQRWHAPSLPAAKSISLAEARQRHSPAVAIVVATEVELRQVLRMVRPLGRASRILKIVHNHDTYYVGLFGAFPIVVLLSGMGSQGIAGATLSVDALIREWNPGSVFLVGIAFGASRSKQCAGDVLVAEHLIPYESQKVGTPIRFRNPIPPSSTALLNRFRNALTWSFPRPDGALCLMHIGSLLSGEKVIDDESFKAALLSQYPEAIGGEMEGTGLWSAATRSKKEWIIVKGVCDWADGDKNDSYQELAAAAAVSLTHHVLSDAHVFDGI